MPGSGKSVCAASLIDQLNQQGVPVLYFFFRQIIDANHSPAAALQDWLDQMLVFSPPLQLILKEYLEQGRSLETLSSADTWRHLRTSLSHHPRAYLVVDALDEMDRGENMQLFLKSLVDLAQWRPSKVKIIITSRPINYIEGQLRRVKMFHLRLEERLVDIDIASYVQHRLSTSTIPTEHHKLVEDAVPGKANGLFLYAKLAMDAFSRPGSDILQVLKYLPADLNIMYTNLLREHARRAEISDEIQLLIMQFVSHATRPLRLLELAQMINITQYPEEKRDLKATKDIVRSACGPLLEILPSEVVCVVHHSLAEFLMGTTRSAMPQDYPVLEFGPTNNHLALVCLSYLQSSGLAELTIFKSPDNLQYHFSSTWLGELSAFTQYAGLNWFVHARKATSAGVDQKDVNNILDTLFVGENLKKMAILANQKDLGPRTTPLFMAVAFGLDNYTRELLDRPETRLTREGMKIPPLGYAAKKGYVDIVELLLQHGADPVERDAVALSGYTPLHYAAANNHPEIITLLLRAGADPLILTARNDGDEIGRSTEYPALQFACRNGHVKAVSAFLPFLKTTAAVNAAMSWATESAHPEVVELLAVHPLIDVNATIRTMTPLMRSSGRRDVRSIQYLLAAGADPNKHVDSPWSPSGKADRGYTALHCWAARTKYLEHVGDLNQELDIETTKECFQLLKDAGANIHSRDPKGNTPLQLACDVATVRLLVDAGADPNAVNNHGETLLHCCRDKQIIQFLLAEAKALNHLNLEIKHPLLKFIEDGNVENALMLLENGADATVVDREWNGAFHYAVGIQKPYEGDDYRAQLIKALHSGGADVNQKNKKGQTALHQFGNGPRGLGRDHVDAVVFPAVVAAGADLNAEDNDGQTPLFVKFLHGNYFSQEKIATCERMIEAGALLSTRDYKGRNLLHAAAEGDKTDIFKWLVDHGVDPNVTDNDGNTIFHRLMLRANQYPYGPGSRSFDAFDNVIGFGVDPLQPNHSGRTPLHTVSATGPYIHPPGSTGGSRRTTAFDYVLAMHKDVNRIDNAGVTALHLAATFSEYQTRRLLESGADPSIQTHEGITSFHLAARGRQSNIIGLLLDSLESRVGRDGMKRVLDIMASYRKTALYYACASGRVESVKLLLEAGASVNGDYLVIALDGCAAFETEQSNWPRFKLDNNGDYLAIALDGCAAFETEQSNWPRFKLDNKSLPDAGSVTADGKYRTKLGREGRYPRERLEEILSLLTSHSQLVVSSIDRAVMSAAGNGSDYTVDCLLGIRAGLDHNQSFAFTHDSFACLEKRRAIRRAYEDGAAGVVNLKSSPRHLESEFDFLMSIREYGLARDRLAKDRLMIPENGPTVLHELVAGGFTLLLSQVLTHEVLELLEDNEWRAKTTQKARVRQPLEPLLVAACRREMPNMEVVVLLMEQFKVDANNRNSVPSNYYTNVSSETALHVLARGAHWWQAAQCIPYLVKNGANMEARDSMGLTPLNAALDKLVVNTEFNRRAVETLIRLGADINSVDDKGVSCIARATHNTDILELLLSGEPIILPKDVTTAIKNGECDSLEAMLIRGADPNGRTPSADHHLAEQWENGGCSIRSPGLSQDQLYPLHYAATCFESRLGSKTYERMLKLLLQHGANPNARYRDTTVAHQVIENGTFAKLFLELPSLDIEAIDSEGTTLFLTACHKGFDREKSGEKHSLPQILIDRGVNIYARDKKGGNALHHLLKNFLVLEDQDMLRRIAAEPDLINSPDNGGQTPIHFAVGRLTLAGGEADILLSAGADPWITSNKGNSVLHMAFAAGIWKEKPGGVPGEMQCEILERLLEMPNSNTYINAPNNAGETPVFAYFRSSREYRSRRNNGRTEEKETASQEPAFAVFDAAGVDWGVINDKGESLLHLVAPANNVKRFKFLLAKGLDPLAEDTEHRTPLDLADASGAKDILDLFKKS